MAETATQRREISVAELAAAEAAATVAATAAELAATKASHAAAELAVKKASHAAAEAAEEATREAIASVTVTLPNRRFPCATPEVGSGNSPSSPAPRLHRGVSMIMGHEDQSVEGQWAKVCLATVVIGWLSCANFSIFVTLRNLGSNSGFLKAGVPEDMKAGVIYCVVGAASMLAIDARAFAALFLPITISSTTVEKYTNRASIVMNWVASYGIIFATLKLSMNVPLNNYQFGPPTPEMFRDIISGHIELNVFTRSGSEAYLECWYGQACAFYVITAFMLQLVWRKAFSYKMVLFIVAMIFFGGMGGYWAEKQRTQTTCVLMPWVLLVVPLTWRPSPDDFAAIRLLSRYNVTLSASMGMVVYMGKETPATLTFVYLPATVVFLLQILKDKSEVYALSTLISILHGTAHILWPFLDEHKGVDRNVSAWQDQIPHMWQAAVFTLLFWTWDSSRLVKLFTGAFSASCIINILATYLCWNQTCHDVCVWTQITVAAASGVHVGVGVGYGRSRGVAWSASIIQMTVAVATYFLFKSSQPFLKFCALSRFFEVYFMNAHVHGYLESKFWPTTEKSSKLD